MNVGRSSLLLLPLIAVVGLAAWLFGGETGGPDAGPSTVSPENDEAARAMLEGRVHGGGEADPQPAPEAETTDIDGSEERVEAEPTASGVDLEVEVIDKDSGRPVSGAEVTVEQPARRRVVFRVKRATDEAGIAIFRDVPRVGLMVLARAPYYRRASNMIAVEGNETHRVTMAIEAAGVLTLQLLDDTSEPVEISAALRMKLMHLDTNRDFGSRHDEHIGGRGRPKALTFSTLPGGRYTLSIVDAVMKDAVRYQPIERVDDREIYVRTGRTQAVDVRVRYRAYVRLIGATRGGKVDRSLTLRVRLAGEGAAAARVLPAGWQTGEMHGGAHFEGYLAPGVYNVVLRRADGREWTERLVVEREAIEQTFPAPW